MTDYYVYKIALPYKVEGVTALNDDGTCTIYINSLRSESVQMAALKHELEHVKREHMQSIKSLRRVEKEADGTYVSPFSIPDKIPSFNSLDSLKAFAESYGI